MPSIPIQPTLNLVVKDAMADAEAAFLKTLISTLDDQKTLGEIFREITGADPAALEDPDLDHAQVQAVKGLLSIRVEQIKLDKPKKRASTKKKTSKKPPRRRGTDAANQAAQ